jgi:hypothetical protein
MKEFFQAAWQFFIDWGHLRHQALQRRGYSVYW